MNTFFAYTVPITLAAGQRTTIKLTIDGDSDFLVKRLMSNETGSFRVKITDSTSSYAWSNDLVRGENLFGDAEYPNVLPQPILLKRSTTLELDIEDLSGAANTIELVFEGYRVYDLSLVPGKKKYFAYVKDFNLNALDSIIDSLTTDGDADFILNRLISWKSKDYVTQAKISLSSISGRYVYSQYSYLENMFGSVLRPNNLLDPLLIVKNSLIKFDLRNLDVAGQSVQLLFDGVKIWS